MIFDSEFAQKMTGLMGNKKPKRIAVAVSGGADSLCLTLLAYTWAKANKVQLLAVTVDHGLRPESAAEADFVHKLLTQKGVLHTTLVWTGKKPTTRVEEKAREERYHLLTDWCRENEIGVLLLAHHQDDQAETFLQRLIRSSGVDGLAGMQPRMTREGVELWRPLLDFSRAEIQDTMRDSFHQIWVEDPSNQSLEYERVRLRQFQSELDKTGLTTAAIALSAKRLLRARQALEQITKDFWQNYVLRHEAGFVFIDSRDFERLPQEIALRILSNAFVFVGNTAPRLAQIETLYDALPCRTTLCDCLFIKNKRGIYICPEYAKMPPKRALKKNEVAQWGRFEVVCNQDVQVAPLGDKLKVKTLPAAVVKTIPAFFDKKGLAFVPALDYKRERTDINGTIKIKE